MEVTMQSSVMFTVNIVEFVIFTTVVLGITASTVETIYRSYTFTELVLLVFIVRFPFVES